MTTNETETTNYDKAVLDLMVDKGRALSYQRALVDATGGDGIIAPPTYKDEKNNTVIDQSKPLDGSPPSVGIAPQATMSNRMEDMISEGDMFDILGIPASELLCGEGPTKRDYDLPHRIFDAGFLRDGICEGQPFLQTPAGKELRAATLHDATALLKMSVISLLGGCWDAKNGRGAKFPRLYQASIRAKVKEFIPLASSKSCPYGVSDDGLVLYEVDGPDLFTDDPEKARKAKDGKAILIQNSSLNFGQIPPGLQEGRHIIASSITERVYLPLGALRKLKFGGMDDVAARRLLASLLVYLSVEVAEYPHSFRSGCELVPVDEPVWTLFTKSVASKMTLRITPESAKKVFLHYLEEVGKCSPLNWPNGAVTVSLNEKISRQLFGGGEGS